MGAAWDRVAKEVWKGRMMARRNKYNAKKTEIDGFVFDSKKEAQRYQDLMLLERAGEIEVIEIHPFWKLVVNGVLIGRYTADFMYRENGAVVVEDVKGVRTRDYVLRKKLMKALYGIEIRET